MTKISINSPGGGGSLPTGSLQLENGDAMDSTLRYVTDSANTQSKLLLSDTDTRIEGSLTVDGGAATPRIIIDADTNIARILSIRTNDLPRWALRVDGTESGSNAGSDFAIRRYNDAGAFIDAPLSINRANGRVSIIERLLLEADSTATTQSTAVIQNPTANSGIAIVPNGTGAITAVIPDGTGTGGNARGNNSVDLQILRTGAAATAVASGQGSVLIGGQRNTASGQFSIALGNTNTASADNSIAIGTSNTASSQFSNVSGGQSNIASTGTHATVVGGLSNVSSGQYSISGGYVSLASAIGAVALGAGANSTGSYSFSTNLNTFAKGSFSQAFGLWSESYLYGQTAFANDRFSAQSDAQSSTLRARKQDTLSAAATTVLSLDGTGVTNLIIPSGINRSWNVNINYVAVVTAITGTATGVTVGDTIAQGVVLGFKRVGGTSSLVGSPGYLYTNSDASMATAVLLVTAGASQQLALTFQAPSFAGGGSITCRIVAKVELTEVAW